MANFPTSTPSFIGFTSSHTLSQDQHAAQHNLEQGEIVALANKMGTGSSTPTSGLVLRGTGAGTSSWQQVTLTTDVSGVLPQANGGTGTTLATGTGAVVYQISPTINAPIVTIPSITGGGSWAGSPSLTTPVIADFTNSIHNHSNSAGGGQLNGGTAISAATLPNSVLKNGLIKARQGGTTGDNAWSTAGTNNTDTSAKDAFIQVGVSNSSSAGVVTVTFPIAYNQIPIVNLTSLASGGFSMAQLESVSATNFTFASYAAAGTKNNNIPTHWEAIGQ